MNRLFIHKNSFLFYMLLFFVAISKISVWFNYFLNNRIRLLLFFTLLAEVFIAKAAVDKKELFCFVIAALYVVFISAINKNLIGQVLSYVLFMLTVILCRRMCVSISFFRWMLLAGVLFCARYSVYGNAYDAVFLLRNQNAGPQFMNPNLLGGMGAVFFTFAGAYIKARDCRNKRYAWFLLFAFTELFEFFMGDRAMMLGAALVYAGTNAYFIKMLRSKRRMKCLLSAVVAGGCVMPVAVVKVFYEKHALILWELFSGRERVWNNLLYYVEHDWNKILFGFGSGCEEEIGNGLAQGSSMHNSYYQFVLYFGLVSVLLLLLFLLNEIDLMFRRDVHDMQIYMAVCFIIFLFLSYIEVLIQHNTFSLYLGCMLGLAVNGRWAFGVPKAPKSRGRGKAYGCRHICGAGVWIKEQGAGPRAEL